MERTTGAFKRRIAIFAVLASVLAACGGTEADTATDETTATTAAAETTTTAAAETTTTAATETTEAASGGVLTVWAEDYYVNIVEPLVADWEAETGVDVQFVSKDFFTMTDEFITAVPAGEGPDVFIAPLNTNRLVTNGVVAPVELGAAAADFDAGALAAASVDGVVYGVPITVENVALFRNTDLVPEPVTTFDELIEVGQALVDAGDADEVFAVAMDPTNGDGYRMMPLQASFGSKIFDDEGNLIIDDEAGIAFAEALAEWGAAGVINPDISYGIDVELFNAGRLPFLLTGPWDLPLIRDGGTSYSIDLIPSAGGQPASPFVGYNGVFQSAQAANPLAAALFLTDFVASVDGQVGIWEGSGNPPAYTPALDEISDDPDTQGFAAVGAGAQLIPTIPAMDQVWGQWGPTQVLILRGEGDPATLWRDMADRIREAIEG